MILSIFIFQTKFKKITADEEEVLGSRMWDGGGSAVVQKCSGSAGGVKEVLGGGAKCWGSGGRAGGVKEVQGE